ncbi:MAG: hypothetical protein ABIQ95_02620, partial [Bdellovibrionia bacterium]
MTLPRMYALFLALSLFHFGNAYADLPEKNEGLIGEIRLSLLTETQFQGLYGKEWVLMDGHSIEGKELAKYFAVSNS